MSRFSGSSGRSRQTDFDDPRDSVHYPTRPVDKDKAEAELTINIKKATSPEETAPKQKHVRSEWCCLYWAPNLCLNVDWCCARRMHCLHLGLPLVAVNMDRLACTANSIR